MRAAPKRQLLGFQLPPPPQANTRSQKKDPTSQKVGRKKYKKPMGCNRHNNKGKRPMIWDMGQKTPPMNQIANASNTDPQKKPT